MRSYSKVLNAFRHPRNFHGTVAIEYCGSSNVLNAFRHPRNFHKAITAGHGHSNACSTPFGILGIFTPTSGYLLPQPLVLNAFRHPRNFHGHANLIPRGAPSVLNAFRHPRNFHGGGGGEGSSQGMCSTPFGIRGIFTITAEPVGNDPVSAQRLSAS